MPYLLCEWRDRIQKAVGEYHVAREALDRLNAQVVADASSVHSSLSDHLRRAGLNLEGTYIVRVFAVFDAALRSYDRHRFDDPDRETKVAIMIDQLGSLLDVRPQIRDGVHLPIERIRGLLHSYLDKFPDSWP